MTSLTELQTCVNGSAAVCTLQPNPTNSNAYTALAPGDHAVEITRSNITVTAPSLGDVTLTRGHLGLQRILKVNGAQNVRIENLVFDGNRNALVSVPGQPPGQPDLETGDGPWDISTSDLWIEGSSNVTVSNNRFIRSGYVALTTKDGDHHTISGNEFGVNALIPPDMSNSCPMPQGLDASQGGYRGGIQLRNTEEFNITNNTLSNYFGGAIGVVGSYYRNGTISNNTLLHNAWADLGSGGGGQIYVGGEIGTIAVLQKNITVSGNYINGGWSDYTGERPMSWNYGIEIDDRIRYVHTIQNHVCNNAVAGFWLANYVGDVELRNDNNHDNGIQGIEAGPLASSSDTALMYGIKSKYNNPNDYILPGWSQPERHFGLHITAPIAFNGVCIQQDSDLSGNAGGEIYSQQSSPVSYHRPSQCPGLGLGVRSPDNISLNTPSGSGWVATVSATFSEQAAFSGGGYVGVLINNVIDGSNACYIQYFPTTDTVYLIADSGNASTSAIRGSNIVLNNSQCSVSASSVTRSYGNCANAAPGTCLTLGYTATFNVSFPGIKNIYLFSSDYRGNTRGYDPMGTWSVPNFAPVNVSIAPTPSGNSTQTFTASYRDDNTPGDISLAGILANVVLDGASACYPIYVAPSTAVLVADFGYGVAGSITLGAPGTVQNSQCTIQSGSKVFDNANNILQFSVSMSAKPAFTGSKNLYLYSTDKAGAGQIDGPYGSWNIP